MTTLALVGAGSLGQGFAAMLAANGQEVTLISTPRSVERLLKAGVIRLYGVIDLEVPVAPAPAPAGTVGLTSDPHDLPNAAGLIFMTKAQQLRKAASDIATAWPRPGDTESWVAGVQNGMAKDRILAEIFGEERLVGGATIYSSGQNDDGVHVRGLGMTYLGEFAGGSSARVDAAVSQLQQAGIPSEAAPDIRSVLWSKACHAAGIFGISATTRCNLADLSARYGFAKAYVSIIREGNTIAEAAGVRLGDYAGFTLRTYLDQPDQVTIDLFHERGEALRAAGGPTQYPSMTQDILAGRSLEVDEVFSDLVQRADELGIEAPRITLLRDLLWGLDSGR
jgi:2-dehydropantoate 2-reductase